MYDFWTIIRELTLWLSSVLALIYQHQCWFTELHGQVTIIFVVSVCLFVCLFVQSFLSRLSSDFDQTRTHVICLGIVVSPRI